MRGLDERMPVLPLRTSRLLLRVMRARDVPTLVDYRNDPAVARYQGWELPYLQSAAAAMIADQDDVDDVTPGRWVQIALQDADGAVVGDTAVGLDASGSVATLGYTVARARQGNGYAREAVAAVVDGLFEHTAVHRIEVGLDPANHASLRVIEPLGFRHEGLARLADRTRGVWLDDLRFALLRDDRTRWRARPTTPPHAVVLAPITADNLGAVRKLQTHWHQRAFVAPVDASLAQALVPGDRAGRPVVPWFRAVVADDEVVGFVLVATAATGDLDPYLWRLLVDRRHQHRGVGREAVAAVMDALRSDGHRAVLVSWAPGPGGPGPFYERLGFVPTGELEDGEVVGRRNLSSDRG